MIVPALICVLYLFRDNLVLNTAQWMGEILAKDDVFSEHERSLPTDAPLSSSIDPPSKTALQVIDRRGFLLGSLSGLLPFLTVAPAAVLADEGAFEKAYADILAGATPQKDLLQLVLPPVAENGNLVAVTLDASPVTAAGYLVERLHLLATDNPWPHVATFRLSPLSGTAVVRTRMRLARSQKVVAVAEAVKMTALPVKNDPSAAAKAVSAQRLTFVTEMSVKVVIGGCGG